MENVIRKKMLCWTLGQPVECGGPGMRTKIYQNGKWYYRVGSGLGYVILKEV